LNEWEANIGASVAKQNATTTESSVWVSLLEDLVISALPAGHADTCRRVGRTGINFWLTPVIAPLTNVMAMRPMRTE
jgi:hypothetical protein